MNEALISAIITGIISIIGTSIMIGVAWKKAPSEITKTYQQVATEAGDSWLKVHKEMQEQKKLAEEQYNEMQGQIDDLRCNIEKHKEEISALKTAIMDRDLIINEWQVGITRLLNQLESHEIVPIWKPRKVSQGKKE